MNGNKPVRLIVWFVVLVVLTAFPVMAATEVKLVASDSADADEFGQAVGISGNCLVVGAPEDDDMGEQSGSVTIFRWDTDQWVEDTKLVAPDGASGCQFGNAVSIDDDTILVGAFRDNEGGNQAGAAYIWKRNGTVWQFVQKLQPIVPEPDSEFGNAVCINGDTAVIGAHRAQHQGNMTGAVYVFERNGANWVQDAKIVQDGMTPSGFFGCSVDLFGNYLIVGAYNDGMTGYPIGGAYVYLHDGVNWNFMKRLLPSNSVEEGNFGKSVSLWSTWAFVGAPRADGNAPDTGVVYIFHNSGEGNWTQVKKLSPSRSFPNQCFGWTLDVEDGYAVVGAPWYSTKTVDNAGIMYVYELYESAWVGECWYMASDMNVNARLGISVSVQDNEAVIGAPGAESSGVFPGAAYWFKDFGLPTPTPTPTALVYDISLFDTDLAPGDIFSLQRSCFSPFDDFTVDEYIILDVHGSFWFWPSWSTSPDFETWDLQAGSNVQETLLEFAWPTVDGTSEDLRFWGGILRSGTTHLFIYDMVTWRYSDK